MIAGRLQMIMFLTCHPDTSTALSTSVQGAEGSVVNYTNDFRKKTMDDAMFFCWFFIMQCKDPSCLGMTTTDGCQSIETCDRIDARCCMALLNSERIAMALKAP
jgi:hypothetical protein